jgi:hypothetical protein
MCVAVGFEDPRKYSIISHAAAVPNAGIFVSYIAHTNHRLSAQSPRHAARFIYPGAGRLKPPAAMWLNQSLSKAAIASKPFWEKDMRLNAF